MKMPLYTGWALEYQRDIARLGIRVTKMQLLESKADLIRSNSPLFSDIADRKLPKSSKGKFKTVSPA